MGVMAVVLVDPPAEAKPIARLPCNGPGRLVGPTRTEDLSVLRVMPEEPVWVQTAVS
jgi:hypothetical protein